MTTSKAVNNADVARRFENITFIEREELFEHCWEMNLFNFASIQSSQVFCRRSPSLVSLMLKA